MINTSITSITWRKPKKKCIFPFKSFQYKWNSQISHPRCTNELFINFFNIKQYQTVDSSWIVVSLRWPPHPSRATAQHSPANVSHSTWKSQWIVCGGRTCVACRHMRSHSSCDCDLPAIRSTIRHPFISRLCEFAECARVFIWAPRRIVKSSNHNHMSDVKTPSTESDACFITVNANTLALVVCSSSIVVRQH